MFREIYLDNAATTKPDASVLKLMHKVNEESYGNASSTHDFGRKAKELLESSRKTIAKALNASPEEIVFTSGGTESNNFALKSTAFTNKSKGNHIITTKIEHDCILETCKWLETQGFRITYLNVDKEGFVSLTDLEKAITPQTVLVSLIHANNEIGTIQDLEKIGQICKKHNVYFHTDACQSFTKIPIDVKKQNLDLVTVNAHKLHGPKGVGALYIKKGTKIEPWKHGGGHEKGMRSGTENIAGIAGFAEAVKNTSLKFAKQMENLRDKMINELTQPENIELNGPKEKRLCNNVNILFKNIDADTLGEILNNKGIYTSKASACTSNTSAISHVLQAIGRTKEQAQSSLRISLCKYTTEKEVNITIKAIQDAVKKLSKKGFFDKALNRL